KVYANLNTSSNSRKCIIQATIFQHRGINTSGELAQLGYCRFGGSMCFIHQGFGLFRVVVNLLMCQTQRHAQRYQPWLDAVVYIAFNAGAFNFSGTHGALPLHVGGVQPVGQIRLAGGGTNDGYRNSPMEEYEPYDDSGE